MPSEIFISFVKEFALENLIALTIRSTHYYLLDTSQGKLMVDAGWAGGLPALKSQLQRYQLELSAIRFLLLTHHHPDHAGLAQEIKQAAHTRLVILEHQIPYFEHLQDFYAGKGQYQPIRVDASDLVLGGENRAALSQIGLHGQILLTPGHSDDSVSLALDSGLAFIGDLHPPDFVPDEAREPTRQSWEKLLAAGAQTFYPAHGDPFPASFITSRSV